MNITETKMELEQKQQQVERLHALFLQSEVHCMVNAEVIAIRGNMGLSIAKDMIRMVDKKSKGAKVFIQRMNGLEAITRLATTFANNAKVRLLDMYGEEKIDENVGNISRHVNILYSMDAEQIVSIMNCTEMVKNGHIPSYLNLEASDYQNMAQKTNIPYEYVAKIVNELQNFTINVEQI